MRILGTTAALCCAAVMVGVKANPGRPIRVHAQPAAEDRHLDLPPLDCTLSDDFKELADCQLAYGSQNVKCHSQVASRRCQGLVMQPQQP